MGYTNSKTDWDEDYEPSPEDMNRIEGNVKAIKEEAVDFDGDKTFNDAVTIDDDLDVTGTVEADIVDCQVSSTLTSLLLKSIGYSVDGTTYSSSFIITEPTTVFLYCDTLLGGSGAAAVVSIQLNTSLGYKTNAVRGFINAAADTQEWVALSPGTYRLSMTVLNRTSGSGTAYCNAVGRYGTKTL